MTNLSFLEIINFLFSGSGIVIGTWLYTILNKRPKTQSSDGFLKVKFKRLLALWIIIFSAAFLTYLLFIKQNTQIFPELGFSISHKWGNTVDWFKVEDQTLKIKFSPVRSKSQAGGGVVYTNVFTLFRRTFPTFSNLSPVFQDTKIDTANSVHIKLRGKYGDEKVEIKLRNHRGEGWYVLGNKGYEITKKYKSYVIPVSYFESSDRTSMGSSFDHEEGLDAIIFAVGSQLNNPNSSELHIKSVHLTNKKRNDLLVCFVITSIIALSSFIISFVIYILDRRKGVL